MDTNQYRKTNDNKEGPSIRVEKVNRSGRGR